MRGAPPLPGGPPGAEAPGPHELDSKGPRPLVGSRGKALVSGWCNEFEAVFLRALSQIRIEERRRPRRLRVLPVVAGAGWVGEGVPGRHGDMGQDGRGRKKGRGREPVRGKNDEALPGSVRIG